MRLSKFRQVVVLGVLAAGIGAAQTAAPPSIFSFSPFSIAAGSTNFFLTVSGSNFQSGAVVLWNSFALATGFQGNTQLIASVPASLIATPGTASVVVVNPGNVQSNAVSYTITAPALAISTATLPSGTVGTAYSATLAATGGVPPYTWGATTSLPPGLTVGLTGSLSGTPTQGGSYTIGVKVTDAQGASATRSFTVSVTGIVIVTPAALPDATATLPYSQTLTASGGTPPYAWSVGVGLPAGLTLNPATGAISGTPTTDGGATFTVQVSDSGKLTASQTFTLKIKTAPLTITTVPPLFDGIAGTAYSQTFSASGGTRPYLWSIASGNTGDLKLDASTGVLQGTPQTAGTYTFMVQLSDGAGTRVTATYSVTVRPPSLTIVTGVTLPAGAVGVAYSQQFSVVGGTPPYTWSLTAGSVPGLAFAAGRATLEGTPATPGTFTFTLQARDTAGITAARPFTLTISPAPLTIATDAQLPDGTLGSSYSCQIAATGGVSPYTWSATGLPAGLSINADTGIISGTLNAAEPAAFAVRVIDSARASATAQFRINVALPPVPQVTVSGLPTTVNPAQQLSLQIAIDSPFPSALTGQAILTFSPEVGGGDGTLQFASGGTRATFTIPAGSTTASVSPALAIQTGTVAGQISISLRLQAGGLDVTPTPAPSVSAHLDQAAPVIQSVTVTRSGSGFTVQVTGYSTAREVTQAVFNFSATSGQTLQTSQVTIPVDSLFGTWYQNAGSTAYGSQFSFTQPFTIQGDVNAVIPQSVTLVNRKGSNTAAVSQ